ncbi:hypothetical protein [Nocardiopsis metallicus]|uniref:TPM domain-containing protein n=1 Tax=Nocardiopsis metallicus TaxID=179819 RepID=A0A840WNZ2_9ACTN|nr:hypothetical protein [Nocardiopsis metallicus]MBB5493466.1 hypothetical protein [Nocardiopsis metallicus]
MLAAFPRAVFPRASLPILLLLSFLLVTASPAATAVVTTEEGRENLRLIAEELREDPVHVQEDMPGAVDEELIDRIRAHALAGPHDVYVVVGDVPGAPTVVRHMADAGELAGVHFHLSSDLTVTGSEGEATRAILLASEEAPGLPEEEFLARVVELVQQEDFEETYAAMRDFRPTPSWEGPGRLETLGGAVQVLWFGAALMVVAFFTGAYRKVRERLEHGRVRLR